LGKPKTPESFWNILWTGFHLLFLDWEPKGRMHIRCGAPLSLKRLMEQSIEKEKNKNRNEIEQHEPNTIQLRTTTSDIVHVVQGIETSQKSITTAIDVASAVQRAIRSSTVVPLTSIIASSILYRAEATGDGRNNPFQATSVDEITADVVDMAALLHQVGGRLGGWAGPPPPSSSRLKRNVVRGLRVLDMVVDSKTKRVTDMANPPQKTLCSPSKRLELSAIRNQWLHLLAFLPYDAAFGGTDEMKECVRNVVTHRYRLYRDTCTTQQTHPCIELTARQSHLLQSAVRSAVEVYAHVGEHLSTQPATSTAAPSVLSSKEIARDIQTSLRGFAHSIDADALALDTLSGAVEWYRKPENKGIATTLKLLREAKVDLQNDNSALRSSPERGEEEDMQIMQTSKSHKSETPLWML
jgi:hypothetical protein